MKTGLVLTRHIFTNDSTIGDLSLDGEFLCNTLEDTARRQKIATKTAIPAGRYEVIINHSQRFNRMLPLLLKVPYFDAIRLHPGNGPTNTEGCILLGIKDSKVENFIRDSRDTFDEVFPKIEAALKIDRLWIDINGGYDIVDFENAKKYGQGDSHV